MWEISDVKARGKEAFKANYWLCVIVGVIFSICTGGTASGTASQSNNEEVQQAFSNMSPTMIAVIFGAIGIALVLSIVLDIFLYNPLSVGCDIFYMRNIRNTPAELGAIGEGFKNYGHKVVTTLVKDIFLCLWYMLFFIPGVIKTYSYKMVPYILADNPELSATEVITRSREMMNGHKMKAFLLDLSFIGWILLGMITCGLVWVFWTGPYMYSSYAALYEELKGDQSIVQ